MTSSTDSGALALVYRMQDGARPASDRRAQPARDLLLARVRGEFSEMPCLSLTIPQPCGSSASARTSAGACSGLS